MRRCLCVFLVFCAPLGCASESERASVRNLESPARPEGNEREDDSAPTEDEPSTAMSPTSSSRSRKEPGTVPSIDERFLFFPTKYPDGEWAPRELDFEEVTFASADGTSLHGWYCPVANPRAVILFAHGNAGNLSHRGPLLALLQRRLRVTVMIFDYRGYGKSEGVATVAGVLQDGRAARKALAAKAGIDESQIVLMGRSLGGAVVTDMAAERRPGGLILESTFSSMRDVAAAHYKLVAWMVPAGKLNSAARIKDYHGPLLQSHGDADSIIPYALGRKLFEAANEPKQFVTIPGGDHNDPQSDEYYQVLDRFLEELP